jgi:hypothetical protein
LRGTVTQQSKSLALDRYFTLGRTGLRVSCLALGTMTFDTLLFGFGLFQSDDLGLAQHQA